MNLVEIKTSPGGSQAIPSTSMVKMERVMEWRKRRFEDDDGSNDKKRARMNVYFRLESESSLASDNDTESVYSIQDKETDVVQDTSDTDTKTNLSDSDLEDVLEYEVASLASSEDIFDDDDCSSSDIEYFHASAGAIAAVICDSSLEKWLTDGESSDNSSGDEVNTSLQAVRKKFNTCILCKSKNNNPYFTNCQKCFQVRKTLFPPRPRGNRKRKRVEGNQKVKLDTLQSCLNRLNQDSNQPSFSQDSGIGSSQEITKLDFNQIIIPAHLKRSLSQEDLFEEPPVKIRKLDDGKKEEKVEDPGSSGDNNNSSSESAVERSEEIKASSFSLTEDNLCIICHSFPKNGLFLHGTKGHTGCCYKCANKTWKTNKRCPVCNCKVNNVIKIY